MVRIQRPIQISCPEAQVEAPAPGNVKGHYNVTVFARWQM